MVMAGTQCSSLGCRHAALLAGCCPLCSSPASGQQALHIPKPTSLFCFSCSTAARLAPAAPPASLPSAAGAAGAGDAPAAAMRLRLLALADASAAAAPAGAAPLGCLRFGVGVAPPRVEGAAAGWRCTALVAASGERSSSNLSGWAQCGGGRQDGCSTALCCTTAECLRER